MFTIRSNWTNEQLYIWLLNMWLLSGPIYILIHVGYEGVCVCSLRLLCVTEKQISVGLFCESVAYFVPLFPLFSQIASIHFSHDSSAGSSECKHFLLNQLTLLENSYHHHLLTDLWYLHTQRWSWRTCPEKGVLQDFTGIHNLEDGEMSWNSIQINSIQISLFVHGDKWWHVK